MGLDPAAAVGAPLVGTTYTWGEEQLILYNLAVGAGDPPTDPHELAYAYERDLQAVPGFGTIPPFDMMMSLASVPGLDVDLVRILHGEHSLAIHGPIPSSGTVRQEGEVVDVLDKGSGALVVLEVVSTLQPTGQPLFTNRAGIYVRGAGGFGGKRGPRATPWVADREPDHVMVTPTLTRQALLYRLASGDLNPLHADPAFAAAAGYEAPILHGLCTFGMVSRAVVRTALGGEPEAMARFSGRFTGHVFPGETIVTRVWDQGDTIRVTAEVPERGTVVLSNSTVRRR